MKTPYDGNSVYTATANQEPLSGNRSFSPLALHKASGISGVSTAGLSAEPIVAGDGRINAENMLAFMNNIGTMMTAASQGLLTEQKATAAATLQEKVQSKAALASALRSDDKATQEALAEVVGDIVYESLGRSGFSRKFLQTKPLAFGDIHRIPVVRHDVMAFYSSDNADVPASQIRQSTIQPTPFTVNARVLIDILELAIAPIDLLDIKYNQALEQILVGEDRVFKKYADTAATAYNQMVYFNTLTPTVLSSIANQVEVQGGIPLGGSLISADIWNDVRAESEFQQFYSPIEKHEIVLTGKLGTLMGMDLVTDGFRIQNLKVLDPGAVYVFGIPDTLGVIGQYDQLKVTAIDQAVLGSTKKGWMLTNVVDMAFANARACARAQRL